MGEEGTGRGWRGDFKGKGRKSERVSGVRRAGEGKGEIREMGKAKKKNGGMRACGMVKR